MKKIISIFFMFFFSIFSLTSCYQDFYYNSLDDYIEQISMYRLGFSVYELDCPDYFLPSQTFIDDFEYISGEYHFYEEDPIKPNKQLPAISLLVLQYKNNVYMQAKESMINGIPMYKSLIFKYENYNFYINDNFMQSIDSIGMPEIPKCFTMAYYNDEKQVLGFMGFYDNSSVIDEKYYEDLSGNWMEFIDTYYGKYYNFDE